MAKDSASPLPDQTASPSADLANTSSPTDISATTSSEATPSATPSDSSSSPNLANQTNEPNSPVPPLSPKLPSSTTDDLSIPVSSPSSSDQASQVQSGPSDTASSNTISSTPPNLANIKPEPPQVSQSAPLANDKITPTPSISDLSNKSNLPKSSSFGDILAGVEKKIESTLEPSKSIPPIETPKPLPSISPPSSHDSSALRQKANQKRLSNKQKHLDQVMALIKESGTISNTDVQRLCRVSQSTATNYLTELEQKGLLKQQGIRGGAKYTL